MQPTPTPSNGQLEETGYRGLSYGQQYAFTGAGPVDTSEYPGALICVEGTDRVGRSTHIALLHEWLENDGYGVVRSALTRSGLAGDGLRRAKEGHTLGPLTMDLFYATDFADRVENEIIPALRAGFVVLTDRYIFASLARSIVRGSDPEWVEDIYRDDMLVEGAMRIDGIPVRLEQITTPLHALTFADDYIVPEESANFGSIIAESEAHTSGYDLRDLLVHMAVKRHEKSFLQRDSRDRHALARNDATLHVRIDRFKLDVVPVDRMKCFLSHSSFLLHWLSKDHQ